MVEERRRGPTRSDVDHLVEASTSYEVEKMTALAVTEGGGGVEQAGARSRGVRELFQKQI